MKANLPMNPLNTNHPSDPWIILYLTGQQNLVLLPDFLDLKKGQKQPPEMFYRKSCSSKSRQFHTETPMLESLFNKVAGLKTIKSFCPSLNC